MNCAKKELSLIIPCIAAKISQLFSLQPGTIVSVLQMLCVTSEIIFVEFDPISGSGAAPPIQSSEEIDA